jgi:CelD/BcsL family acetyltransferase involved in cellulose biosynthesis
LIGSAARALSVEVLADRAAFAALAPEWEALRRARGGGPFFGPTWFAVTAASIARNRLRLLVAHRGGRLAGVLPLLVERRRLAGLPARVYRSLSDDHSQRFDLIGDAEAARALWAHLAADRGWDALELREIPDGESGAAPLLAAARADGHALAVWPAMRSPYLLLGEAAGSAKFRANLRRRERKLVEEVGAITLERVDGGPALDAALEEGFALEAAGWKGERGTAIACDPSLSARYRALAHAFAARGELAVHFLRAGGRRVAFHFALLDGGVYYLFKPGFDPALSRYGLGHLLVGAVIRDLEARGARELDFLGDEMPWKREWTARVRPHHWHTVFARSAWGRALSTWKLAVAPRLKPLATALGNLSRR